MRAHETNSIANGALAEDINGVRTVQRWTASGSISTLYDEKAQANLACPPDRRAATPR